LFNLIAQQDNATNIEIARDSRKLAAASKRDSELNIEIARDSKELAAASKRDSAAMKIIAVLTTVFLPGTFISVSLV
jgi:hypothetical protein